MDLRIGSGKAIVRCTRARVAGGIKLGPTGIGCIAWGHLDWVQYEQFGVSLYNADKIQFNNKKVFRSDHPGSAQFVYVDGSVHFVPQEIDYPVLRALVTRAGGETENSLQ